MKIYLVGDYDDREVQDAKFIAFTNEQDAIKLKELLLGGYIIEQEVDIFDFAHLNNYLWSITVDQLGKIFWARLIENYIERIAFDRVPLLENEAKYRQQVYTSRANVVASGGIFYGHEFEVCAKSMQDAQQFALAKYAELIANGTLPLHR